MRWMTPEWPQALNCQKDPVYIEYSPQISLRFALRPAIFEIQAWQKSEMFWMTLTT